MGGKP